MSGNCVGEQELLAQANSSCLWESASPPITMQACESYSELISSLPNNVRVNRVDLPPPSLSLHWGRDPFQSHFELPVYLYQFPSTMDPTDVEASLGWVINY